MSQHLKTKVINGLARTIATFVQLPPSTPVYSKGVRYFVPAECIQYLWGAMNKLKIGQKRRKHIIVRYSPHRPGLLQLYTYHFPKTWSAACQANREIIKLAQRRAHAMEHSYTREALEWRIRFFKHYFRVFKGHQEPEAGLKAYSRFYQYAYVCIYRELKAALNQSAQDKDTSHILPHPIHRLLPSTPLSIPNPPLYVPTACLQTPKGVMGHYCNNTIK